jgi:flagellar hook assembly protein FlgD
MGKKIKTLADKEFAAGNHKLIWDGKDSNGFSVSGGVYCIEMKTPSFRGTIKSIFLK